MKLCYNSFSVLKKKKKSENKKLENDFSAKMLYHDMGDLKNSKRWGVTWDQEEVPPEAVAHFFKKEPTRMKFLKFLPW